jgi:hypothetical protein
LLTDVATGRAGFHLLRGEAVALMLPRARDEGFDKLSPNGPPANS